MKIILFGRWRTEQPGGPDNVILSLAREFAAAEHSIAVWSFRKSARSISSREVEPNISVTELPVHSRWMPWLPQVSRDFIQNKSATFDAALFFSVFIPANVYAARVLRCQYATVPLGGYARASIQERGCLRKRLFLALAERGFLENAQFVNVWSQNEQRDVERISQPRRCIITPPGFYEPRDMPVRAPRTAKPGRTMVFLGRLDIRHKGLDRLVLSFGRVACEHDSLIIAGADSRGSLTALKKLIHALPRNVQVELRGVAFGEAKWALFQEADVFVHTSRWEGLPLVVIEALAFGVPALVTSETNAGDYIRSHDAGWVAEPTNLDDTMCEALGASAADLNARGENAHRMVAKEFRWDTAASTLAAGFAKAKIARLDGLWSTLARRGVKPLVLRDFDGLPSTVPSDLDLTIHSRTELPRLAAALHDFAATTGLALVTVVKRSYVWQFKFLRHDTAEQLVIDVHTEGEGWRGPLYLTKTELFAAATERDKWFEPALHHQTMMAVFQHLLWGGFYKKKYHSLVPRWLDACESAFRDCVTHAFGADLTEQIVCALRAPDAGALSALVPLLRRRLWLKRGIPDLQKSVWRLARFILCEILLRVRHAARLPTLVGPDGALENTTFDPVTGGRAKISRSERRERLSNTGS
jgi:glycosyltransferase involved in cell wall biosynthesis